MALRNTIKSLMIGAFCLGAECSFAQYGCAKVEGAAEIGISPRWTATGMAYIAREFPNASDDYSLALGARFELYERVYADAAVQMEGQFLSNDAEAEVYTLREALTFVTPRDWAHKVVIEQRRLAFSALEHSVNCSRLTYALQKRVRLNDKWAIRAEGAAVMNTKSELTDANVVQRLRIDCGVERDMGSGKMLSLRYGYQCMGKEQTYIADRHRLHTLTLRLFAVHRR